MKSMRFIGGTYFLAIGAGGPGKTVEKVLSRSGKTMDDIEDKEDDEGDNELGGAGTGTGIGAASGWRDEL